MKAPTATNHQPRTYENQCAYCGDKFTRPEPRRYCSKVCKELDEGDHRDFQELKEMGFYTNQQEG